MFKSKSKKGENGVPDIPSRSTTPQPSKSKKKLWGRKKEEPEPVPQLDLGAALPADDNFRTSLLMPGLSTRFSMLREQDDPNSILGKANDDSVLFSHRKSRLGGFGDTGLSDIAEVASIAGSIRPPFATGPGRSASYHTDASIVTDDDSTTSGSILGRARPGEGNMLFGGRQKIYKIPVGDAGSVKNLGANEPRGMKGRALYEDDVHMSAFQKYREQERLAERDRKLAELEREMQNDDLASMTMNSPSLSSYDQKRETTSSTNSGPSRMSGSTAATSIISHTQPGGSAAQSPSVMTPQSAGPINLQRSNSRRLYDSNLEHHMGEQQPPPAFTRKNSMQRKPSAPGRTAHHQLTQSRSATNLRERFGPPGSLESSRAASPLPPTNEKLTTFEALRSPAQSSPVSPHFVDADNPLYQAVDKADRGKATALGQFNKPKQFDEQQFLARQQSLHMQRKDSRSPRPLAGRPSNDGRRPSMENKPFFPPKRPSEEPRSRAGSAQSDRPGIPPRARAPTGQSGIVRPSFETRSRSGTGRGDSSRPSMDTQSRVASQQSGPPSPVAARNLRSGSQSPVLTSPTKPVRTVNFPQAKHIDPQASSGQQQTAMYDSPISPKAVIDDSPLLGRESDDAMDSPKVSLERGTRDDVPAPLSAQFRSPPKLSDHPALRAESSASSPTREDRRNAMSPTNINGFMPPVSREISSSSAPGIDLHESEDPESGASSSNQLNGMIRSHLRHLSTVSSVYPTEERQTQIFEENFRLSQAMDAEANPFAAADAPPMPTSNVNVNAENIGVAMTSPIDETAAPKETTNGPRPGDAEDWMRDLHSQHTRDASTGTMQERKAFAEDLRTRQKAIQDNLRVKAENTPRGVPAGNVANKQNIFENGLRPFNLLRKSSSREDLSKKKMGLGISAQPPMPPNPMRNGIPGPFKNGREQPPGRTLHMRMPDTAPPSASKMRSRSNSRPRKNSYASEQNSRRTSPPESSRTSTSTESRKDASDSSSEIRRSDFPSGFNSGYNSTRPSLETMRQRSDSAATRNVPPIPPLRTNGNMYPPRPPMQSLGPSTMSQPSTTPGSPMQSGGNTPPLSSTSLSSPDLRGQTNTSLSQTPMAGHSPILPTTLPTSTYMFPPRADHERPSAAFRRNKRSPTVNKQDISQPTLLSSTSTFETVDLDQKRAQLQAMAMASAGASPVTSPGASGPMQNGRAFFGRAPSDDNSNSSMKSAKTAKGAENEEDDFITRPGAGRMRIRKISSEGGSLNSRRHEAIRAENEGDIDGNTIAGGMI